ncbi:DUF2339 domain-containing protein [Alphaproteobacteria bacterium KMM 3653]|uniref:DUF2339 domain-containing protein n=1 Tax=Harenicola maris TaxID=2841044 RepID=A0AAP2G4X2_9RHOB|nr:DUF2339 domain-containing protein [Harenicola maris]
MGTIAGGLVLVTLIIAVVVLIGFLVMQSQRLSRIEKRLSRIEAQPRPAQQAAANPLLAAAGREPPASAAPPPTEASAPAMAEPLPKGVPSLAELGNIGDAASRRAPGAAPEVDVPPRAPAAPTGPGMGLRFGKWMQDNWVYAISALSLALAGIFLVQYGMEQGIISPAVRLVLAFLFGVGLVAAGQYIRLRQGHGRSEGADASAFLPSTFSGAGLVVLYAVVIAAHLGYGFIGAFMSLVALVLVSGLAMVLGWISGPFLAAVGIIGGLAAPFVVDGEADSALPFYVYFALLGLTGLAIDTMRRWAWVSVLALVGAACAGFALFALSEELIGYGVMLVVLTGGAIAIPQRRIWPDHSGPGFSAKAFIDPAAEHAPGFPVWLAGGAVLVTSVLLTVLPGEGEIAFLAKAALLMALFAGLGIWACRAPALAPLAVLPVGGFTLLTCTLHGVAGRFGAMVQTGAEGAVVEAGWPILASVTLGLAAAGSAIAAWRSLRGTQVLFWALIAAFFAPVVAAGMEMFWVRGQGGYTWALHILALAALITLIAERFARGGAQVARRGVAWAALSALSLIALAMTALLDDAALTIALGVLIIAAAALDRQFKLREMGYFIVIAVIAVNFRYIAVPGLEYLFEGPLALVIAAFVIPIASMGAAWLLLRGMDRGRVRVFLESGALSAAGIGATVMIFRAVDAALPGSGITSHWAMGLLACLWIILAIAQIYRLRLGGALRWLRMAFIAGYALIALMALLIGTVAFSPLVEGGSLWDNTPRGVTVANTMFLGYALPGLLLLLATRIMRSGFRVVPLIGGCALMAYYVFLEIRWFWQPVMDIDVGFIQPELYSYTVALLITGGLLLYQAIARRSVFLRRIALVVIGLAVAKVFLVDMRGLTGLLRVFSFLALGLSLAGLAWLDRWAKARSGGGAAPPPAGLREELGQRLE